MKKVFFTESLKLKVTTTKEAKSIWLRRRIVRIFVAYDISEPKSCLRVRGVVARSYKTSRDRASWLSVILNILVTRTYLIGTYVWVILLSTCEIHAAPNLKTYVIYFLTLSRVVVLRIVVKTVFMSQLVPYHLSSEQDDSLMFATMFDYQIEDYNKPKVSDLSLSRQRVFQGYCHWNVTWKVLNDLLIFFPQLYLVPKVC